MKYVFPIICIAILLITGCTSTPNNNQTYQDLKNFYLTSADPNRWQIKELGYIEETDDVDHTTYGIIVYKETDLDTGIYIVKIFPSRFTSIYGSTYTFAQAENLTKKAQEDGVEYGSNGPRFNPIGVNDPREVEYRIYQTNGEPTYLEIYIVGRDADRQAKPAKTLKIDWPYQ